MNNRAIAEFVTGVTSFGAVRAKVLRDGKEERLINAVVTAQDTSLKIEGEAGAIEIPFAEIEQIIYSPEKRKYFVHLVNGLVEVRPDQD